LFINPIVFGLQQAAIVVIWVLVGGRKYCPAFWASSGRRPRVFPRRRGRQRAPIVLGAVLIAVVIVLPEAWPTAPGRRAALAARLRQPADIPSPCLRAFKTS
jgi:hypothetical protein